MAPRKTAKKAQLTATTPITAGNLLAVLPIALVDLQRELEQWRAFGEFLRENPDVSERLGTWQEKRAARQQAATP